MKTVEMENQGLKRSFMLTIAAKEIEARVDKEVRRIAPQVRMPGFRPGKVPPNLIRKMHGDSLQQDALTGAVRDGVQKLLQEQKLRPALQPEVELDEQYEPGKDAEVRVRLEALPDVPVPQIEGLKLERLTVDADEAAVDEQLQKLAQSNKSWSDAPDDHAARLGDLVVMDFAGTVGGKPFEGGTGEDMSVELGSGRLIPGFEEGLVGAKARDHREVEVKFPADYPSDQLKGKAASFAVTVKAVKTAAEAKPDEDFAKSLGLTSIEQLRGLVRDQLQQELNGLTRTHMKRRLLDQLAAKHDFPVPASMVEAEYQNIMQQLRHEAEHEEDPKAALAEIDKDSDEYRGIAERRVRLGLLLSEIGQANGVEVSEQEMNRLIGQAASQYQGKDRERFVQYVQQEPMAAAQLRAPLYEDKVVDFLFAKAEITERKASREELEADLESEEGHVHGPGCGHDHAQSAPAKAAKPRKGAKAPKAGGDEAAGKKAPNEAEGSKPAKAKKAKAQATTVARAAAEVAPSKAAKKVEAAKGTTGKPAPSKVKLTEPKSKAPKPAKPLKNEPANKAAAKAAEKAPKAESKKSAPKQTGK